MVFALNSIDKHFNDIKHKNLYKRCCDDYKIAELTATSELIDSTKKTENNNCEEKAVTKGKNETKPTELDSTVKNKIQIQSNEKAEVKISTINSDDSKTKQNITKERVKQTDPVKSIPIDDSEICEILNAKYYITSDENGKAWCILCNWLMDPFAINNHINDLHHQTMLKMHKKRLSTLNAEKKSTDKSHIVNNENDSINNKENVDKESILNAIEKFQKNNININFEIETAVCKKCSKQLDFNYQAIEDHIKEHAQNKNKKNDGKGIQLTSGLEFTKDVESANKETCLYTTPVKFTKKEKQEKVKDTHGLKIKKESTPLDINELEKYAKQNHMTYIFNENKVHCNKCDIDLIPSMKIVKEHVGGVDHKKSKEELAQVNAISKSKQIDKEANFIKIPTSSFILSAVAVDSLQKVIIINDKLCIHMLSIVFMVKQNERLKCFVCDCNIPFLDFHQHLDTPKHEAAVDKSLVLIEMENEFIREVGLI